jgi:DNA-binding transcriptional LysR family regulator
MYLDSLTLECFVAVAETGSFTRASERVGRTQSAVSQQISKLEMFLDRKLFERGKQLTLSPDGEILLGYAKKIVHLNHELVDYFKHPELKGEVSFGLPEDFASVFLSEVLSEFSELHPRFMLHIECDLTLPLYEKFKRKELDLVVVKMSRPEHFPNGIDVWSERLDWVGNADLFGESDDDSVPLVLSPHPCVYRSRAIQALENMGRKWRIVFSSQSYASTIAAVKAGMGVTVLPHNMVPQDLQVIDQEHKVPELQDIHVSLLKHNFENSAVNSLEEFVLQRLKRS